MSLIVTVLLIATLLTITVNERLGEIATLRAIGVSRPPSWGRSREGTTLTSSRGAWYPARPRHGALPRRDPHQLPGLPASFSFFVPRADVLSLAALVLLATGSLAASTGLARVARADRGHAARGGHLSAPAPRAQLRKDYR